MTCGIHLGALHHQQGNIRTRAAENEVFLEFCGCGGQTLLTAITTCQCHQRFNGFHFPACFEPLSPTLKSCNYKQSSLKLNKMMINTKASSYSMPFCVCSMFYTCSTTAWRNKDMARTLLRINLCGSLETPSMEDYCSIRETAFTFHITIWRTELKDDSPVFNGWKTTESRTAEPNLFKW